MFGMMGLPSWDDEDEGKAPKLSDDVVEVDDIVEVGVRDRKPVLSTSTRIDALANLRVLGVIRTEDSVLYLALVTDADARIISPTTFVDKWKKLEYEVEDRFYGEEAIVFSESHIRKIVLKQNGRFCARCKDYNSDVRLSRDQEYTCRACVLNPYR